VIDYSDIISIVKMYVNVQAVVLSVAATQLLKYLLPSQDPEKRDCTTAPGTWYTRLMPVVPLLVGTAICVLIEKKDVFVAENVIRGMMSGILAAWVYRTTKVTIFGA